jgi:hypothetical protein
MNTQAGMSAQLFERSMEFGEEWKVCDVWFKERRDTPDELHVRVAHKRIQAVKCPVCHRSCTTCDTRERTLRYLDI